MKKTIAFESYPDYSNNSKIMYEYFVEKYPVEYNYIWIVYDIESKQTLSKLNVQTISPGDIDFQEKFINIDVIFSTHNFAAQYKKKHQTLFCLWHGGGFKKQGFFNDIDRENLTLYHQIDYFNSSSEYMATVFSATLALNIERFLTFGNPRSDILLNSDSKKNLEKIYNIKLSKYNKILIYLPTFRKSANRNEGYINEKNILNFDSYNEKEVLDFLEKNKYLLIRNELKKFFQLIMNIWNPLRF